MQSGAPLRLDLAEARLALLHLMRNHHPGHAAPTALLSAVKEYLRLYPNDAEVREAREALAPFGDGLRDR